MVLKEYPMRIVIDSVSNGINSLGKLRAYLSGRQVFECDVIELAWLDNKPEVSSIPAGEYILLPHKSPKFGNCFKVYERDGSEVRGRKHILVHSANYASSYRDIAPSELRGCIALGYGFKDLNEDGVKEIMRSRKAMADFRRVMSGQRGAFLTINRNNEANVSDED